MPQSPSTAAAAGPSSAGALIRSLFRRNEAVLLVCLIVLIVFWSSEGTRGPNRFGPDPLGAPVAA